MGEPLQLVGGGSFYCSSTTPCPPNYFCHIGADVSSTVCCPTPGVLQLIGHKLRISLYKVRIYSFVDNYGNSFLVQASPCMLPVIIGTGQAQLNRFYYNAALQLCVPFVYSGLGGNQNNFVTLQDCANECLPLKIPKLSTSG